MSSEFENRCAALLASLNLCAAAEVTSVRRLTGGVASDIAAVSFRGQTVCVKFALARLNVAEDWFAPVHRGRAEYAWLKFAGETVPGAAPILYGWSKADNGFIMEFLTGDDVYLWKTALLAAKPDQGEAPKVAEILGRIHAASTGAGFDAAHFDNAADFDALRLDPYLRFTAGRHPQLSDMLLGLADRTKAMRTTLVHGDVSPKNILIRSGAPVILDAECATMGDPAFDVAFCLNHLMLKSFHLPAQSAALRGAVMQFWQTYAQHVLWEPLAELEARVAALLPALMLARIDGKSPVEYMGAAERDHVRSAAIPQIARPAATLAGLLDQVT
ncbi:MAG: phosphotransferase family protein [Cypionkella sp.]